MYGELWRDFCLIEAGALLQLLMNEAPALNLGICPVGGMRDNGAVRTELALDDDQVLLHCLLGGVVDPSETGPEPSMPRDSDGWSGSRSPADRIRAGLAEVLPDYMVSRQIFVLEEMPLTGNGKVDRKALAALSRGGQEVLSAAARAPATESEQRVAEMVCQVLDMASVDVGGNFFELGASSLHLVQLVNMLRRAGYDLEVVDVFEHSSVERLARYLAERGPRSADVKEESAARRRGRKQRAALRKRGRNPGS